jgi:hypothetical protein
MSTVVDTFGGIVGSNIYRRPLRVESATDHGYFFSGQQMKLLPDRKRCASEVCGCHKQPAIRAPLSTQENSAVISEFLPCDCFTPWTSSPVYRGIACYLYGATAANAPLSDSRGQRRPADYCSYHKHCWARLYLAYLPRPRLRATTLACDANNNTSGRWRTLDAHNFTVDVPDRENGIQSHMSPGNCVSQGFMEEVTAECSKKNPLSVIRRETFPCACTGTFLTSFL